MGKFQWKVYHLIATITCHTAFFFHRWLFSNEVNLFIECSDIFNGRNNKFLAL